MKRLNDCYTLSNGVRIPCVAYGTYLTPDGSVCADGVRTALECGYRHVDTAEFYANEASVGRGIRESGVPRKDVFVTTKVWNTNQGYRNTLDAFQASLDRLQMDYVDMYLIHWPNPLPFRDSFPQKFIDTWNALEKLYKEHRVHAIGVCNSLPHHLKELFRSVEIKPMVNQIELHLGYIQTDVVEYAASHNMLVEAWAPLCRGRAFGTEPLRSMAIKYHHTEAQILVRWCLQHNWLPLPKSVTPSRIVENSQVFDFEIGSEDMAILDAAQGVGRIGSFPDTATF